MQRMTAGMVTAFRTLTILPLPGRDAEDMAASLPWFPLVGCALGFILYGLSRLLGLVGGDSWPEGVALVLVLGSIVLTRGLHLDGLADWADAFGSMSDRQRTLEIMQDPRVGAFAVVAVVVVLLAKWVALARLAVAGELIWIVAAYIVSRAVLVELACCLPYARPCAGTGAAFVQTARPIHRLWSLLSGLALLLGIYGPAGGVAVGVGWGLTRLFGFWCYRRVGGVTGDLLGACSEIVETLVLLLAALCGTTLARFSGWETLFR